MTLAVASSSVCASISPSLPTRLSRSRATWQTRRSTTRCSCRSLRDAIQNALGGARSAFCVRIEPHGHLGEILVRIGGRRASLQLSFERDEAEPGYVAGIVRDAVGRFGL
jgi:hypothetical protein